MTTFPNSSYSNQLKRIQCTNNNYGKSVLLAKGNQEFKVILNEQDASKENQQYITIHQDDIIQMINTD
ncbi:unnamed protein product [Paramecium primaurelia]|uniref:Uncharacterized protein n=1 Tax=Paramecium primaurelia TaxID=5886 RepID=A0A8S1QPG4_PARPR|nr:unnamed protein product [Paramecium primaurelia]